MINNFISVVSNYSNFEGRATRSEFWYFALAYLIINIALGIVDALIGFNGLVNFSNAFALFMLVPYLAVGARRLHDTGRSGWFQLIMLIPLVGIIALLVMWTIKSDSGENRFGPQH
ncbi:DUF805 domain-containing protein (plasmid) [Pseudomonas sp. FeN3W]|nr:DUF805 domain-containing protein [Pseudomonas sp. FeN3W]